MKEKTKIFPFLLIGKIVIKMKNPIEISDFLTIDPFRIPIFSNLGTHPGISTGNPISLASPG